MNAQAIASTISAPRIQSGTMTASRKRIWAGRFFSGLSTLFFLLDGGMKLFKPPVVVEGTLQLGYPESAIVGMGIVLILCTILYLIPRTAILGAVLLTGYLGGAVATHVARCRCKGSIRRGSQNPFPQLFHAARRRRGS